MTPGPMIVDPVAVSSGFYPAIPDSVQPDFGNLHQDLLQPHLLRSSGDNKRAKSLSIIAKSKSFLYLWCTSSWHFLRTINNPAWEDNVSFAQCHWVLCLSTSARDTETFKCWWANRTMDDPRTVVQDILVPYLLPRNAQSSCAWVCEWTSLAELHYAGAAPDLCAFTRIVFQG